MSNIKKFIAILSIILLSISYCIVLTYGKENYIDFDMTDKDNISIKYDKRIIKCSKSVEKNKMHIKIYSQKTGKTTIVINSDEKVNGAVQRNSIKRDIYVHKTGVITVDHFFGYCNGDVAFLISFNIIVFIIILYLINKYRKQIKNNLYSYGNVRLLGLICYISIFFTINLCFFIYDLINNYHESIIIFVNTLKDYMYIFTISIFPLAFVLTIMMMISNIKLLKIEGRRFRNIIGSLLGGFICLATIILVLFGNLYYSNIYSNVLFYVLTMFISYLECVFIGTCVLGIKAAKHIPKFDKDAIIILGCKIRNDGTLTPLLKSRVDRAIEFSKMQKEVNNKDIIFIPSGGKGIDEVISEAEAMKNYLLEQGIKNDNIIVENKSTSTIENIKYSNKLIKKNSKVAFSTTNYHVFRAGIIASNQISNIKGIGAKTKTYYWINAFIREFVATLVLKKKSHVKTLIILSIIVIIFTLMVY